MQIGEVARGLPSGRSKPSAITKRETLAARAASVQMGKFYPSLYSLQQCGAVALHRCLPPALTMSLEEVRV